MTTKEATSQFKDADDLYREGRFADALRLLDLLDKAFPGNKNIMFPRARCLAKLARNDEALVLCNQLADLYNHGKARELRARIMGRESGGGETVAFGTLHLDSDDDGSPVLIDFGTTTPAWIVIGLMTAIVGLSIALGYYLLFIE